MKVTNKILLVSVLAIVLILTGMIIAARVLLTDAMGKVEPVQLSGTQSERSVEADGFQSVSVAGAWELDITEAEQFSVRVSGDQSVLDSVIVSARGGTLYLSTEGNVHIVGGRLKATIAMPSLVALNVAGGAQAAIHGFTEKSLRIESAGAANVSASETVLDTLGIRSQGAGDFDFKGARVKDADIAIEGAGNVSVTMTGGVLGGHISGVGHVEYYGTVSDQRIRIDGLGSVQHQ